MDQITGRNGDMEERGERTDLLLMTQSKWDVVDGKEI